MNGIVTLLGITLIYAALVTNIIAVAVIYFTGRKLSGRHIKPSLIVLVAGTAIYVIGVWI